MYTSLKALPVAFPPPSFSSPPIPYDPAEDGRGGTDAIQRAEDEEAL